MIVLFLFTLIFGVWLINRLATFGDQLQKLSLEKSKLDLENKTLEMQISKFSSLQSIENQAILFGFEKIKKIEYLKGGQR